MKFYEIITGEPVIVQQNQQSIEDIINILSSETDICVTVDENQSITGIISRWHLLRAISEKKLESPISELIDTDLFTCDVEDDVEDFLQSKYICALVYQEQQLMGIVNKSELVATLYERIQELNNVMEASFDSLFVTDARGKILRVNDAYTRLTGIPADEILGRTMYELVEEGYYDRSATVEVIKTGKSVTFTQNIKTGKTLLVTGNPIYNKRGELIQVLTNGRDITELNRLKQEVEHANELTLHYQRELQKIQMETEKDFVIGSEVMKEIMSLVMHMGKVDSTVLVQGESGVGKEIIARELHNNSYRKDKPYIRINCAAIPETLLESELFGYEAGAFTGAKKEGKMGIFEIASGGTLFLDEIGDISYSLQVKLLRVLQEGEIIRVGGVKAIPVDVRIITSTNRDLWKMVQNNTFREDLYYRLNVVPIYIPPLRERKEEIPMLVAYFEKLFNNQYGLNKRINPLFLDKLMEYDWPGNIRELRNIVERAIVTSPDDDIKDCVFFRSNIKNTKVKQVEEEVEITDLKAAVEKFEKKILSKAIKKHKSSRKVASALGVSQTTIIRKATRYGLDFGNN